MPTWPALWARIQVRESLYDAKKTVKQFIERLLALRNEGEYDPEVISVADSILCGELSKPVYQIVTFTDRACKEMSRLSRLLKGCIHPIAAVLRI